MAIVIVACVISCDSVGDHDRTYSDRVAEEMRHRGELFRLLTLVYSDPSNSDVLNRAIDEYRALCHMDPVRPLLVLFPRACMHEATRVGCRGFEYSSLTQSCRASDQ